MTYRELLGYIKDNGMQPIQAVIADEVDSQADVELSDSEFEAVCKEVFYTYVAEIEEPDVWYLVDAELTKRNYKKEWV